MINAQDSIESVTKLYKYLFNIHNIKNTGILNVYKNIFLNMLFFYKQSLLTIIKEKNEIIIELINKQILIKLCFDEVFLTTQLPWKKNKSLLPIKEIRKYIFKKKSFLEELILSYNDFKNIISQPEDITFLINYPCYINITIIFI